MQPNADQDQLIREKSFLLMVPLFAGAGLFWTCLYYYFGARTSAIIPGSYVVVSFMSLFIFRWQKNFNVFRTTQLSLILVLPCLLHLSFGNFVSASGVIIWATLCPLGALAFSNAREAGYWLFLFITCLVVVYFLENKLTANETRLPHGLLMILFFLNIALVTFLIFYLLRYFVTQNELVKQKLKTEQTMLANEREKSEKLLLNILPLSIAQRLKEGENVIADEYDEAVILFADIVEFTNVSQHVSPAVLVENLNKIFTHFDSLVDKYSMEKIKTIGDAYMVAAGLGSVNHDKIKNMADLALAMLRDIKDFSIDGVAKCELRIGIHVGSVTAGVIGSRKFTYDVWGDAVNTASRLQSSAAPGKIQVSEKFYNYIKEDYDCVPRGQVEIKGKGLMNLYFLTGKKQPC